VAGLAKQSKQDVPPLSLHEPAIAAQHLSVTSGVRHEGLGDGGAGGVGGDGGDGGVGGGGGDGGVGPVWASANERREMTRPASLRTVTVILIRS